MLLGFTSLLVKEKLLFSPLRGKTLLQHSTNSLTSCIHHESWEADMQKELHRNIRYLKLVLLNFSQQLQAQSQLLQKAHQNQAVLN